MQFTALHADGSDVTLGVTLVGAPNVTLAAARPEGGIHFEGDEVEEVEDPPFSPGHGDNAPARSANLGQFPRSLGGGAAGKSA